MRDIDALDTDLALLADRDSMDHGAEGRMMTRLRAAFFERDRPCSPFRQRLAPARHLGSHIESLHHVRLVRKVGARDQLAAIEIGIFARGMRKFIHKTLAIEMLCR